jgi:8-oxo-dGTP pyrophosphatase MutT (NUDIX family)
MTDLPGFARHFQICNRHDPEAFAPFVVEGQSYGFVRKPMAARLPGLLPEIFEAAGEGLALLPRYDSFDARSEALARANRFLSEQFGRKLRGEMYAVTRNWGDAPVAQIDRAAVPWYGVHAWGVHINGFVRRADGLHMWVGLRADDRPMDPGKLDCMVGGGMPIGLSIEENMRKEAHEEAGFGPEIANTAKLIKAVDYQLELNGHLRNDTLFVFDLELPEGVVPRNTDGEVAEFRLLPIELVAEIVATTDRFKFNCNMIITDFLVRHGVIGEAHPEYAEIQSWLKPGRYSY